MLTLDNIQNILDAHDSKTLEDLALQSRAITHQYFGRTISLYAPVYISNYCSSHCTYCGFNCHNKIERLKLSPSEIEQEMAFVAGQKIENILILTGESYSATPLSYLVTSIEIAKKYFANILLEIHPLETNEYQELFNAGADGLTVYQETFNRERYKEVHLGGKKQDYDFRYHTAERAAQAGFRQISLGILLGLSDPAEDLFELFSYLRFMEKNYPGVEYSLSFPRLRSINGKNFTASYVDDATFIKIICLTRILFPRIGINLSTRESAFLRDHAIEIGVTRISAGSSTEVGGYAVHKTQKSHPQFDVDDNRSVHEIIAMLKSKNFDPVLTDWRRIQV